MEQFLQENFNFFIFLYGLILIFGAAVSFITYKSEAIKPKVQYLFLIFLGLFTLFLGLKEWLELLMENNLDSRLINELALIFSLIAYANLFLAGIYFFFHVLLRYEIKPFLSKKLLIIVHLIGGLFFAAALIIALYINNFPGAFRFILGGFGSFFLGFLFIYV